MGQFTLVWDNSTLNSNPNITTQRASYKYKPDIGHTTPFLTDGFTPANDFSKTLNTVDSKVLDDNKVIQFKIQSICNVGGPIDNSDGIKEGISFACVAPDITKTDTTLSLTVGLGASNITKVRYTLRKASDDSVVAMVTTSTFTSSYMTGPITGTFQALGLLPSTNYYLQLEFYANVNNIEVISSDPIYLGIPCSPYAFTTDPSPTCVPITAITISSIELP